VAAKSVISDPYYMVKGYNFRFSVQGEERVSKERNIQALKIYHDDEKINRNWRA
jgi:hypothetical protein